MASKYEKEVVDILLKTKGKAVCFLVLDGIKGTSFEVRTVDEKYMRQLPKILIEIASRIEGDLNAKDLEKKKIEMGQHDGISEAAESRKL